MFTSFHSSSVALCPKGVSLSGLGGSREGLMPKSTIVTPDASISLAHALVSQSDTPLLLLDGDLRIIWVSDAFCSLFNFDCKLVYGKEMKELGGDGWAIPQLGALLSATAAGMAKVKGYEFELKPKQGPPRCLVVNAHKLDYSEEPEIRILVAIADITDERLAERIRDDLLQEKAVLYRELQHRVANSLQIVASVLLQTARRVQSDETRAHLSDAHNRVMSIAALQKQLAASGSNSVAVKSYFVQLCGTIGASMIRDTKQIHLYVTGDDSEVESEVSVSLGLVVTELVINALKYAFPGDRYGKIHVDYHSSGPEWILKVSDNGVGMEPNPQTGLGTNIVNALAKHLEAEVTLTSSPSGTSVMLIHSASNMLGLEPVPEPAL